MEVTQLGKTKEVVLLHAELVYKHKFVLALTLYHSTAAEIAAYLEQLHRISHVN